MDTLDTLSDFALERTPPVAGAPARVHPVILGGQDACCDWLPVTGGAVDDRDGDEGRWLAAPVVVCSREAADDLAAGLAKRGITPHSVIAVPRTEGSARALTAAALLLIATDPEATMLVCDGALPRGQEAAVLDTARQHVAEVRDGAFVLLGSSIDDARAENGPILVSARRFLQELELTAPEVLDACADSVALAVRKPTALHLAAPSFEAAPALSIRAAVMTHGGGWTVVSLPGLKATGDGSPAASSIERAYSDVSAADADTDPVDAETVRPWGTFRTVDRGNRFQVKQIVVKPGGQLSLQMHHHRSEHWVVVAGTARIVCGDEERLLHENEHVFIQRGERHRLENPGKVTLRVIEVQSGGYLGEDDIVRFDDIYGRVPS